MKKADLEKMEASLMEEVVRRRQLGGYNPDAPAILMGLEMQMRLLRHIIDNYPPEIGTYIDTAISSKTKKK